MVRIRKKTRLYRSLGSVRVAGRDIVKNVVETLFRYLQLTLVAGLCDLYAKLCMI